MKIALLGSVTSVIPPMGQAAIERLVYAQAIGLADKGHTILLFAPRGSRVEHANVQLIEVATTVQLSGQGSEGKQSGEKQFGASYKLRLEIVNLARVLSQLYEHAGEYEVILNNLRGESVVLPVGATLGKPVYHILHLPIFPELADLFKTYNTRLISISNAQRKAFPDLTYAGTVYNGVDTSEFTFSPHHQGYVLYLGSIGRNKNPKDAILAAKKVCVPIKIGGRIKDEGYYKEEIAPHIDGSSVSWIGELHPDEVVKLYQGAKAFLFPTLWEEPFGLVMIEAMSCGTPVIAYPHGAIPEVVEDGKNGYIVNSVDEMAQKITIIDKINRHDCRSVVEQKFSINSMIAAYEQVISLQ